MLTIISHKDGSKGNCLCVCVHGMHPQQSRPEQQWDAVSLATTRGQSPTTDAQQCRFAGLLRHKIHLILSHLCFYFTVFNLPPNYRNCDPADIKAVVSGKWAPALMMLNLRIRKIIIKNFDSCQVVTA